MRFFISYSELIHPSSPQIRLNISIKGVDPLLNLTQIDRNFKNSYIKPSFITAFHALQFHGYFRDHAFSFITFWQKNENDLFKAFQNQSS